jgi:O-antigen/teichoic acid export membrane protein
MRDLWLKVVHTSGAQIYGLATGLVLLSVTARWLGPDGRGSVAAILGWVNLIASLGSLSLGQVALHRASQTDKRDWLGPTLASLLFFATLVTLLGWGFVALLFWLSEGEIFHNLSLLWLIIGFLSMPFVIWGGYSFSLLVALDKILLFNRYQYMGRTLSVALALLLLMNFQWGVAGALLASLAGQVVAGLGGISLLLREAKGKLRLRKAETMKFFRDGLKLHLNAVGAYIYTSSDVLLLNYFSGPEQTGYYQLGVQLISILTIPAGAVSTVMYSEIAKTNPNAAWPKHRKALTLTMILMIIAALCAGWSAPWWLTWVAGDRFGPTLELFRWQLLGVPGMTLSSVMAAQWIGRGLFWQAAILTFGIGLFHLTANLILIPEHGAYGAVASTLGVYFISLFGNTFMAIYCQYKASKP